MKSVIILQVVMSHEDGLQTSVLASVLIWRTENLAQHACNLKKKRRKNAKGRLFQNDVHLNFIIIHSAKLSSLQVVLVTGVILD